MKQINCSQHIVAACSAIHLSLQSVKALFHGRDLHGIPFFYQEGKKNLLEIRFDSATLTCVFDENNICEKVFLFSDDPTDITHYIEHCNEMYHYETIFAGWIVNNRLIQISTDNEEYSLMVQPCGGGTT